MGNNLSVQEKIYKCAKGNEATQLQVSACKSGTWIFIKDTPLSKLSVSIRQICL